MSSFIVIINYNKIIYHINIIFLIIDLIKKIPHFNPNSLKKNLRLSLKIKYMITIPHFRRFPIFQLIKLLLY